MSSFSLCFYHIVSVQNVVGKAPCADFIALCGDTWIDELNVQGHKRLTIKENGDVFVTASGKQQPVDTIPDFPPRPAWEDLCVLAREDDIAAEVCNQELTVSWA